jgi:hypothetical protein
VIYCGSGFGSYFGKVLVPVPVPVRFPIQVPVPDPDLFSTVFQQKICTKSFSPRSSIVLRKLPSQFFIFILHFMLDPGPECITFQFRFR